MIGCFVGEESARDKIEGDGRSKDEQSCWLLVFANFW